MTDIPAGYQIHFSTWENDMDSFATEIWSGITQKEDVHFLVDLANRFQSKHTPKKRGVGNSSVSCEDLVELVTKCLDRHPLISSDMRALFMTEVDPDDEETTAERWYDLLCDRMLGYPENEHYASEENFCRVMDNIKVYWIPNPIEEVTESFMPK